MKVISVYVSENTYAKFKEYAEAQDRPVAELIREAMELYRSSRIQPRRQLTVLPTTAKPKLKRRWTREEIQEELLG
ncbi:MAG: ribbon-helix-helix protein, CopG family [Acidobacteria bacterium]|nr:MAG: ribbon-helix-helix protein, CopG family [Acidobacteriota bacterium]